MEGRTEGRAYEWNTVEEQGRKAYVLCLWEVIRLQKIKGKEINRTDRQTDNGRIDGLTNGTQ